MGKFDSYILQEKIHETRGSIIYRGHKKNESQPVIIKFLKTKYPTPSELAWFKQEYNLIKGLNIDGVIKTFDIIRHNDEFALILEDFDGVSIKSLLDNETKFDIRSFLDLSIKIAETLGSIHMKGVVHRDIKPHNILVNQKAGVMKITDFGISVVLTRENDEVYNPDFIVGTLGYMSPEQTGRMNRTVDYRTDLYSLGITLYEMLIGDLPFKSRDPMELIHSHIAIMPEPPAMKDSGIPVVISDIIMRLLSKNQEERYQNGFGLVADLRECIKQLDEKQKIESFELGRYDISNRFMIPPKLFGREKEIGRLVSGFDAVANNEERAAVMFVAGAPGIGKSAMVNEIHKPIAARRGYFISGKYEQFRRDKPYSAIIQALQALVKQILFESEKKSGLWREKILAAVGTGGKVITDVIPEVELIIGKQSEVPVLGPEESKNRFNFLFGKFMSIFPEREHPVVLFLDDLQWADLASLQFLKNILTGPGLNYCFLIFSCRDNDVSEFHPVMDFLRGIEKSKVKVDRITLDALNVTNISDLIKYFLKCSKEKGAALAEIIIKKTGGNPFFVNQFLQTLYNEKMIVHEGAHGWQWDVEHINRMRVTENLVEMMAGKIGKLSISAQEVLKICACIGNRIDLETLAAVRATSVDIALGDLTPAINEGMVSQFGSMYVFHHDRIQEGAYSLVPDAEKSALHYKIGKLSLDSSDETELQKKLFYIVDQLNLGLNMIKDAAEREKLAKLNLEAAKKAKASAAYAPALNFVRMGITLLPGDGWENHYELTYSMYREAMECEYLSLNFNEAEKIFNILVKNAKSNIDRANAHSLMIILYTTQGNYKDARRVGYQGMKMVGFKLPDNPNEVQVGIELLKLRLKFGRKKIEDLIDMQYLTDTNNPEEWKKTISTYMKLHPSKKFEKPEIELMEKLSYAYLAIHTATVAYYSKPNLFAYIAINGACWLLDTDVNFEYSPYAYISIGSIMGSGLGFYKHGYRFGVTALKINEKIADIKNRSRVEFTFAMFIQHWRKHAKKDLNFYRKAFEHGLEVGDMLFCGHSIKVLGETRIMLGDNLDEFREEYEKYRDFQMGSKDPFNEYNYLETIQMYRCLKGLTSQRGRLNSDDFNENEHMSYYREGNNLLGVFYLSLIILRVNYLFGNYSECPPLIDELKDLINKKVYLGALHIPEAIFYSSLVMTASYSKTGVRNRIKFKIRLMQNQMKMKIWAKNCPENFEHKYLLIEAEMAGLKGNHEKAEALYDRAIKSARKNQYTQNEAIANERAALFMRETGDMEKARQYMKEAHYGYIKWGATEKVKDIEKKYSDLITNKVRKLAGKDLSSETERASGSESGQDLDLTTVIKASQAISGEIELGRLLDKMMRIVLENAGAQRGSLLLELDGELIIEASGDVNSNDIRVLQSMPLQDCTDLCQAIVNYVYRSGENVVLGNAAQEGPFIDDPYIMRTYCKSILCTPIMNKSVLSGILYLENNLAIDTFTPERLSVLKIISAQAAISIENARLFELATTDGLTKLYVHRYFQLLLDQEIRRAIRHKKNFTIIMTDIDNFKAFNDTYGHQLGDKVLRGVADVVKKVCRAEDIVARYGGEEFVIVLPETDAKQAMIAAEKIRAHVAALDIDYGSQKLHVTISLGVATFPTHAVEKEALIHSADAALYTSKHNGKNRTSLADNVG